MKNDELIKQAISAFLDGEATSEERRLAEEQIQTDPAYKQYAEDLKKISGWAGDWEDESLSPDLEQKIQKFKEREGFQMKSLTSKFNYKFAGGVIAAVFVVVLITKNLMPTETIPMAGQTVQIFQPAAVPTEQGAKPAKMELRDQMNQNQLVDAEMNEPMSFASRAFGETKKDKASRLVAMSRQIVAMSLSEKMNTEAYSSISEPSFKNVTENPLSTFSIDVDTASYSNIRRFLNQDQMPPQDAVRIEEMINYFHYDYPKPEGTDPFSITTEMARAPWNEGHQLVLIGLKGKELEEKNLAPSNLVFLVDVSGSMNEPNKLPLLQQAFRKLVGQLSEKEKVAIVTYAGNAGLVLKSTPGSQKSEILQAVNDLTPGGSTAGAEGINLAYQIAEENYIPNGNNRVILATDGDFNVGVSSDGELVRIIEAKRSEGIFLTVLGFGGGNLKDSKMEQLANKGNGNYFYIDSIHEAHKVLVKELGSTLFTIAKDVKIQVEFNPAFVKAYRLVGYENRTLANEDFNNDKKDAGELGSGHTVTALYEIVPADSKETIGGVDPLKYQKQEAAKSSELLTVKFRYKEPAANESKLITKTMNAAEELFVKKVSSENFKLAGAIAEFGLLLRKSEFKAGATYQQAIDTLKSLKTEDPDQYREELIQLIEKASALDETPVEGIQFKK